LEDGKETGKKEKAVNKFGGGNNVMKDDRLAAVGIWGKKGWTKSFKS